MSVDVRERLRRVLGPTRSGTTAPGLSVDRPLREAAPPREPTRHRLDVEHLVPGRVHVGERGSYFVAERRFPADQLHGRETLGTFRTLTERALACLARRPTLGPLDRPAVVFLDTETNGLSGGAGR